MLTATVDLTKTPAELTVKSDKREVEVTVKTAGETAVGTARYPITTTDTARTWKPKLGTDGKPIDDGITAVFIAA